MADDILNNGERQLPPVTRLVMFRHGVAYVERSGSADGSFEMTFKRSEMNDVLKSFAVWVAAGDGRVAAVAFEAPDDPLQALSDRNLSLDPDAVGTGLLATLRGRRIAITTLTGSHEGEVLGIDNTTAPHGEHRRRLLLHVGDGRIDWVDLRDVCKIHLVEQTSRADLGFYLDKSRAASAGTSRSVTVTLTGNAAALHVSYVVPSAIWRVSYRLVIDEDDQCTLMAWAIVHNPVDEDVHDVALTLTTGQPVSFEIDLYGMKHVKRAVVEETSRAASAPRRLERAMHVSNAPPPAPPVAPAPAMRSMAAGPPFAPQAFGSSERARADDEAFATASAGVDRGEFFEYQLATSLSLKRGGSAMVPLASAKPNVERQRLWRAGDGPNPDLVLHFINDSDIVLEEGPVVIYDGGSYAGEAMVPYSARGAEVKLAFAKDLAVRCSEKVVREQHRVGITLDKNGVLEEQRRELRHTLQATSDHDKPVTVIFEVRRQDGHQLALDAPKPKEETPSFWRFALEIPAHQSNDITVVVKWRQRLRVHYQNIAAQQLTEWLRDKHLDQHTFAALEAVLHNWQRANQLDRDRQGVEQRRQAAYEKQAKISQQLGVLRDTGPEGKLRLRYVTELGHEQNRVNALEQELTRLRQAAAALRARAAEQLAQLTNP